MPADVETMFSVRELPWHGHGLVLANYPGSWAAARPLAGLAWDPVAEPVFEVSGITADGRPHHRPIDGWVRISRSDTAETLSINRDSYAIIDHAEMGEIVEAVLGQPNVHWETAGVLGRGRAVWCLAKLDEPIELPGDPSLTLPYLAITNRHDGTGACALRATAVRIVCANTFRAAELEGKRHRATFSFIHKRGWRDRIDEARAAVTGARRELRQYEVLARQLLATSATEEQRRRFVDAFIPLPPEDERTDRRVHNTEEARRAVRAILESPTTAAVADIAYGLVQAAGEYLDHVRRAHSFETRLTRTVLQPEPLKARALALAREVTAP